jgi:predicted metal-dependent hydrolase
MWAPHLPEFAAAANAISLGMPYAEPLFIRAMRSTFDRIDPDLRARSESYIRQETGHHTQHKKFNDIVTAHYPALRHVQRLMAANDRLGVAPQPEVPGGVRGGRRDHLLRRGPLDRGPPR